LVPIMIHLIRSFQKKLRKITVSPVISVCLYARMEIWYLRIFRKSVQKIQVSLGCEKNNGYCALRPINIFIICRSVLLRVRNVLDKNCRENQKIYLMSSNNFLCSNEEKFGKTGQTTDNNMAHAHFMLDT
jgi:hypothetical protein